ncbi:centrosomal protein of 135 kDa-like [Styela clava]
MSYRARRNQTGSPKVEAGSRDSSRGRNLNHSLDGSSSLEIASLEAKNKSNDRLISHLNIQVEYLQKTNQELEDRINELEDSKSMTIRANHRLEGDVDKLHAELRNIDNLAQQMEDEKKNAIEMADREIQDAQIELRNSKRQETLLETKLLEAEEYQKKLMGENDNLQNKLAVSKSEVRNLNDLIDKIQSDKKLLSDHVQSLTSKEKKLATELERYRISPKKAHRRDKSPSKLDSFIRTLEKERDYYKDECDVLNTMLQNRSGKATSVTRARGRSRSPGLKKSQQPKTSGSQDLVSKATFQKIVRERDELQKMLDKFENHTAEIQANVRVLSQERDKSNMLYEQAHEELQRLRRMAITSPKSPKASLTAQAILHRVENERDTAITDLRRMTTERDSLRERLKIQQEQAVNERTRLEQKLDITEDKLHSLNQDRVELQTRLDALKGVCANQEEEVKLLRLKLQDADADRQSMRAHLEDMRIEKAQTEANLETTQRHLNRKAADLDAADDRTKILETRIADLLDASTKQGEDISKLRATISSLDLDKDSLQAALDEKTDRVNTLEDLLAKREHDIVEQKMSINNLETKLEAVNEELANNERECRTLRRQLENSQTDLSETARAKDVLTRESRRLQDDNSQLTRENQDLNQEIDDVMRERDDERNRGQDLLNRISHLENGLASKERELQDVLDQYRKVSAERDSAESKHRISNDEAQELKLEVMSLESEKKRLAEKTQELDREIMQYMQTQQSYEAQVKDLRNTMHRMESDLHHIEDERKVLISDVNSVRDLNSKLDISKEQCMRQYASRTAEYEELKSNFDDLTRELNIVHKHLDDERMNSKKLEDAIANSREKEFQAQLDSQEIKSEGQMLRDKLSLNESKLQSLSREVSSLRTKSSQLESELEATRRHSTNERYERERAVQELRRHGLPSPGLFGMSGSTSPGRPRSRSGSPTRVSFLDSR